MAKRKCNIMGSSFHKGAGAMIMRMAPGTVLQLRRQPDNPADANAVAVYYMGENMIGYLGRDIAAHLAPLMDSGMEVRCTKLLPADATIALEWDGPEMEAKP